MALGAGQKQEGESFEEHLMLAVSRAGVDDVLLVGFGRSARGTFGKIRPLTRTA